MLLFPNMAFICDVVFKTHGQPLQKRLKFSQYQTMKNLTQGYFFTQG